MAPKRLNVTTGNYDLRPCEAMIGVSKTMPISRHFFNRSSYSIGQGLAVSLQSSDKRPPQSNTTEQKQVAPGRVCVIKLILLVQAIIEFSAK